MPTFSKASLAKLETCHPDLQEVFKYVIKSYDCTIIHGQRTPEEQFELFKKGRSFVEGRWKIVKPQHVVTYLDGYEKLSNHNYEPSRAVDVMPWYGIKPHIRWDDFAEMKRFGMMVKGVICILRKHKDIENDITWGGDWASFRDYPHWEIA
jgi:peptidoglycan L-alanyl-D-glutamate endopeptidase CwlK